MTDEPDEPTQETPQGHEIPVPSRQDVFRDLGKVARPLRGHGNGSGGTEDEGEEHRPS